MARTGLGISYVFTDTSERKSRSVFFRLPATMPLLDAETWANDQAPLLDAVTDGKMTDIVLSVPLGLPGGLKGSAVAGAWLERTGLLNFALNGTAATLGVSIPGIRQQLILADRTDTLDTTSDTEGTKLNALINALKSTTLTLVDYTIVNPSGIAVVSLNYAKSRARRK